MYIICKEPLSRLRKSVINNLSTVGDCIEIILLIKRIYRTRNQFNTIKNKYTMFEIAELLKLMLEQCK